MSAMHPKCLAEYTALDGFHTFISTRWRTEGSRQEVTAICAAEQCQLDLDSGWEQTHAHRHIRTHTHTIPTWSLSMESTNIGFHCVAFCYKSTFVHIPTPVDVSLDSGQVQLPEPESPKSSKVIHLAATVGGQNGTRGEAQTCDTTAFIHDSRCKYTNVQEFDILKRSFTNSCSCVVAQAFSIQYVLLAFFSDTDYSIIGTTKTTKNRVIPFSPHPQLPHVMGLL